MTIDDVKIIELPKHLDARGNLSFVEQCNQIPFEIRRPNLALMRCVEILGTGKRVTRMGIRNLYVRDSIKQPYVVSSFCYGYQEECNL